MINFMWSNADTIRAPFDGTTDDALDYIFNFTYLTPNSIGPASITPLPKNGYRLGLAGMYRLTTEEIRTRGLPDHIEEARGQGAIEGHIEIVRVTDRRAELVFHFLTPEAQDFLNALASKIEADGLKPAASGGGPQIIVKENYGPIINTGHDANIGGDVVGRDKTTNDIEAR